MISNVERTRLAAILGMGLAVSGLGGGAASAGEAVNWKREAVIERQKAFLKKVLPNEDVSGDTRIVGGNTAAPGAWPIIAALVDPGENRDYYAQFCGGSIVRENWILTAAHCVDSLASGSEVQVLVGTQTLSQTSTSSGTRYNVAEIYIHPQWNPSTYDYDVALLELSSNIPSAPTIALLTSAQESALTGAGDNSTVIGWGNTSSSSTNYPTQLQEVDVPFVDFKTCKKWYSGDITKRMVCAGPKKGGKDSCQGDSGGPLMVEDSTLYQAGIVSWGNGCAQKKYPGVYSRVALLEPWITSTMDGVPSPSAKVDSKSCAALEGPAKGDCFDKATAAADKRIAAYLGLVRSRGGASLASAADVGQTAWKSSLTGLCRFAESAEGALGRKACVLEETERRVKATATMAASLGR